MSLRYLTAGESHGPALVAILEGMPAGLLLPSEVIDHELARRQQGYGSGARMKIESDSAEILSGVMAGVTTGAPLAFMIQNRDHVKWQDKAIAPFTVPRPGHADLTAAIKYGYTDLRPSLERASARETAARVAVGAVCKHFLQQFRITVGGYVASLGEVEAEIADIAFDGRIATAETNEVRCPAQSSVDAFTEKIRATMQARDTLGGIIEILVQGLPVGLGSHVQWDRRIETRLSAAIMSVQAMKGVEIGDGFANTRLPGTQAQDQIYLEGEEIVRKTHRAGGVEGGITNGGPLILRAAMKPIATTLTPQHSVDLATGQETDTQYERSDFCPVPRAVPILEAVVAYVLADALLEKLGGDQLAVMQERFERLPKARLSDIQLANEAQTWWRT
ncbi:MAG: chorismate synthase [Anaerolineales bacterium]|nr:chorismate synthase [Anaerolineales bacterium]